MPIRFLAAFLLGLSTLIAQTVQPVPAVPQTGQPQTAAPAVKPEERCSIEGTISNLKTGQPLGKAEVRLRKTDRNAQSVYEATSDASGHYVIDEIDPGKYTLSASRNGYVDTTYGSEGKRHSSTLITLAATQHMKQLDLKLPSQAVVTGRVFDEGNEPMANVKVQLMFRAYQNGKRTFYPVASGNTNDKGEYRIFGVRPGKFWAMAHAGGNMMVMQGETHVSKKDQASYPPTYYPSGFSLSEASPLQLVAGAEIDGIDFHLVKVKSFTISGKIANAASLHMVNVQLMPRDSDGSVGWDRMKIAMVDENGTYTFRGVQPGHYDLSASNYSSENRSSTHAEVLVADNDVDAPLEFGRDPDISGLVRTEDTSDILKPGLSISLQPDVSSVMMITPGETKEDGTFTLKSVAQQRLRLNIYPLPEGHYIKSIQLGNQEQEDTLLDLTNGAPGELTITLSAKGATLTGSVQDDKQKTVTTAMVVLVPDNRKLQSRYLTAAPDQNGQFTIKNVPPGSYKLFAFDSAEYGVWLDAEWLKTYETKGESVEVKESQKASKNLIVIPTDDTSN